MFKQRLLTIGTATLLAAAATGRAYGETTTLASASAPASATLAAAATTNAAAPTNLWFSVGESLSYKIYWGPFWVGITRIWSEWIEEDGRRLVSIKVSNRNTPFLQKIYPVNDLIESVVDPVTFLPLRFAKQLSEGRYRLNELTTFDHAAGTAHWKHLIRGSEEDFAIDPDTRDIVSFMYYMRGQKLEPNQQYAYRVMSDEKLYDLILNTGNYETLDLPNFGKRPSLRVDPEAKFQGFFVRVGRVRVWISNDQRFMCTEATAKIKVGTVHAILDKVEGPGNDDWSTTNATAAAAEAAASNEAPAEAHEGIP